jgi:hypothetical protein
MSDFAELFTATATMITAIVAVFVAFLPSILRWYNKPRFKIEFENKEPFCRHNKTWFSVVTDTSAKGAVPTYWIRLRVKNVGHSIARGCEGKLVSIKDFTTKEYRKDFDPVVLHWVGSTHNPIDINKSESEYLDAILTRVDEPRVFYIRSELREDVGTKLTPERKDYLLEIVLYGENVEPLQKSFYLKNHEDYDKIELSFI